MRKIETTIYDYDDMVALREMTPKEVIEVLKYAFVGEHLQFKYRSGVPRIYIKTLEGDLHASVGDYIIKGVNGEFYPCKPDIFKQTYEEID